MEHDAGAPLAGLVGQEGLDRARDEDVLDALELVTVDEDGWPHVALLSAGEVLPTGTGQLALCLWPSSSTSGNLTRTGQGLLHAVHGGVATKLRLSVEPLGTVTVRGTAFAGFLASVAEVTRDEVGYAEMVSGPRYRLTGKERVLDRWQAQLDALAAAATRPSSSR